MNNELEIAQPIETKMPVMHFTSPFLKITKIHVEREMGQDERTGRVYVRNHRFVMAEGIDIRDNAEVEIDWSFSLRGKTIDAWTGFRITPREWKDDMIRFANAYAVKAVRLGLLDAEYVIHDAPKREAAPVAEKPQEAYDEIPF